MVEKWTGMSPESSAKIIELNNRDPNKTYVDPSLPFVDLSKYKREQKAIESLAKVAVPPANRMKSASMPAISESKADGVTPNNIGQGVGGETVSGQAKTKGWDWMDVARKLAEMAQAGIYGYTGNSAPLAYRERQAREQQQASQAREDALRQEDLARGAKETAEERAWRENQAMLEREARIAEKNMGYEQALGLENAGNTNQQANMRLQAQLNKQNAQSAMAGNRAGAYLSGIGD